MPLDGQALAAMRYIGSAEAKKIFAFKLEGESFEKLKSVCEAYVLSQLERGFSSLDYWKKINL
jgi:DNA repair protein RecO (recombination protein O)